MESSSRVGVNVGIANLVLPITASTALELSALVGVGTYNGKSDIDGIGSTHDTTLAFNIGAGYDFGKNRFPQLRFCSIQTDGDALTPCRS